MRDVFAGAVAIVLLFVAASLGTTLGAYRRRRQRARDSERALGRTVIVEIPGDGDLILFSEDAVRFHYGERSIDKDLIVAVRMLINGSPISDVRRRSVERAGGTGAAGAMRAAGAREEVDRGAGTPGAIDRQAGAQGAIDDSSGGIIRDRWDVEVETLNGTTVVECGAIRERV
jgi:hypothetical protein